MKKIILLFIFILSAHTVFAENDPTLKITTGRDTVYFESELIPSYLLRVGSPAYNFARNLLRNIRDVNNKVLTRTERAILMAESLPGVGPNSLLLFSTDEGGGVHVRTARSDLSGQGYPKGDFHTYILDQSIGLGEIIVEDGIVYPLLSGIQLVGMPFHEILSAALGKSTGQRFINSGKAVVETALGPVYAVIDVCSQASEGDFVRSLKAVLRLPFSIFSFGTTVATKAIRLPVDIIVSVIRLGINAFSGDNLDVALADPKNRETVMALAEAGFIQLNEPSRFNP